MKINKRSFGLTGSSVHLGENKKESVVKPTNINIKKRNTGLIGSSVHLGEMQKEIAEQILISN